jgi:2-oxo-3-hexenedioate decarboxylase
MYDTTVGAAPSPCSIGALIEPRIEPEIALRLAHAPRPEMDEEALLGCVDAVAHGFEIVHSIYPGWRSKPADAVAAFGMHGLYRHGPFVPIDADRKRWADTLSTFTVTLLRDGVEMDQGGGSAVLGSPLASIGQFIRDLQRYPGHGLQAGDIVTTGTLTRPFPIAAGERWSTKLNGAPLAGLDLVLSS